MREPWREGGLGPCREGGWSHAGRGGWSHAVRGAGAMQGGGLGPCREGGFMLRVESWVHPCASSDPTPKPFGPSLSPLYPNIHASQLLETVLLHMIGRSHAAEHECSWPLLLIGPSCLGTSPSQLAEGCMQ